MHSQSSTPTVDAPQATALCVVLHCLTTSTHWRRHSLFAPTDQTTIAHTIVATTTMFFRSIKLLHQSIRFANKDVLSSLCAIHNRYGFATFRFNHVSSIMSALPWPVDTITENQARSWFENGIDLKFTGSWRLNTKYKPKLTAIRRTNTQWAFRFKRFKKAYLDQQGKVKQQCPEYTFTTSYNTAEAAETRCYRDIYAKIHENVALFRPPDVVKRKAAMIDRDVRTRKRASRSDPEAAAKHVHETRVQELRLELSRRSTLRPRNLQTETPQRTACSQQAGVPAQPVRAISKPHMSRKQLAHQRRVQKLSNEANEHIANATKQMQAINEAYEKAEAAMKEVFSSPTQKRSASSARVLDWNCELESGIMLSTMSESCIKHLMMQMKSVYRYYVCAKTLWQQRLKFVKALMIGQPAGRKPRLATCVREVLTTQSDDTSSLSNEKFPCHVSLVRYVKQWENHKSFHIRQFARGNYTTLTNRSSDS